MKTTKLFSILAAVTMTFAACTDNGINNQNPGGKKDADPEIECTAEQSYSVADKGVEDIIFSIISSTPWSIEVAYEGEAKDWITATPANGGKSGLEEEVKLSISDNTAGEERNASVSIKAEGIDAPLSFSVKQAAKSNLEVSGIEPAGAIAFEGGSVSFSVTSNKSWTITSDAQDWLKLDKTSGEAGTVKVNATASANEQALSRKAKLTIATDSDSKELVIEQAPYEKIISLTFAIILDEDKTFSARGETKSIGIVGGATEADWDVLVSTPFSETYGTVEKGDDYIGLSLPRSQFAARGPVTLKLMTNGELTDQITLYQESLLLCDPVKGINCVADETKGTLTIMPSNESNGNAVVSLKAAGEVFGFKFGSVCYNLAEVDIKKGEMFIETWQQGYQIQVYAGVSNKFYVHKSCLSWADWTPLTNVPALNEFSSFKFVMNPLEQGSLPSEVWINNNKVGSRKQWVNDQSGIQSISYDFGIRSTDGTPCEGKIVVESIVVDVIE